MFSYVHSPSSKRKKKSVAFVNVCFFGSRCECLVSWREDDNDDIAAEPCEGEVAAGIEADDYDDDAYDALINAELLLPKRGQLVRGPVMACRRHQNLGGGNENNRDVEEGIWEVRRIDRGKR